MVSGLQLFSDSHCNGLTKKGKTRNICYSTGCHGKEHQHKTGLSTDEPCHRNHATIDYIMSLECKHAKTSYCKYLAVHQNVWVRGYCHGNILISYISYLDFLALNVFNGLVLRPPAFLPLPLIRLPLRIFLSFGFCREIKPISPLLMACFPPLGIR